MSNYAYLRVSTQGQILERQEELMRLKEIPEKNWYREKVSGGKKSKTRPVFDDLLQHLKTGDTLYVESMSRLGRNLEDLIATANYLTNDKKVNLWLLKENMFLSADAKANPMQTMMFNIFGAFAQFQKDIQNDLIRESLAIKKENGQVLGKPRDTEKRERIRQYITSPGWNGSVKQTAIDLGVNARTIKSVMNESEVN